MVQSHHVGPFSVLRRADLIEADKRGVWITYSFRPFVLEDVLLTFAETIRTCDVGHQGGSAREPSRRSRCSPPIILGECVKIACDEFSVSSVKLAAASVAFG